MTKFLAASIGSYPRIGEDKDQQRYRRALNHLQNKEISEHAFRDVEQSLIQELIREQLSAGLDEVTDGLAGWNDPVSHVLRKISGVRITSLRRYFDTNFYYRVPVIASKPKFSKPTLLPEFLFAKSVSHKPVRVVLTGPVTLALHTASEIASYQSLAKRAGFFTEHLRSEIEAVAAHGATHIQIDEPGVARQPEHVNLLQKSLTALTRPLPAVHFTLALYYAPLAPLYNALARLPVDGLNLDFTYDGRKLYEAVLSARTDKTLGWGLVDARTTKMAPIDPLIRMVDDWAQSAAPAVAYLTPSAGLEFLPREQGYGKLKQVAQLASELNQKFSPRAVHAG